MLSLSNTRQPSNRHTLTLARTAQPGPCACLLPAPHAQVLTLAVACSAFSLCSQHTTLLMGLPLTLRDNKQTQCLRVCLFFLSCAKIRSPNNSRHGTVAIVRFDDPIRAATNPNQLPAPGCFLHNHVSQS